MKLIKRNKKLVRRPKPSAGHSLSSNSYYRPNTNPIESLSANSTKKLDKEKNEDKSKFNLNTAKLINWAILLVFVILAFFATTLSATADIKIQEGSFSYRNTNEYQEYANELLRDNPLSRSKLFFRSSDFEEKMQTRFPEISFVEALLPLGGRDLTVSLSFSEPLAVVQNGESSGVVDSNGILITEDLQYAKGLFNVRFASPQESFDIGSSMLTSSEIKLLNLLSDEIKKIDTKESKGLTISEVLFNVIDGQFEVKLKEVPYFIKLSTYSDTEEQVGGVVSTLNQLYQNNEPPTKYIDIRVPGRVFVF